MGDPKRRFFEQNFSRQPANGTVRTGYLQRPAGIGASAYRDELGDALGLQSNGVGVELNLAEGTQDFLYNSAYNANVALADLLFKNCQLNHDRNFIFEPAPHIHWFQAKDYSPNFLLEYRWQINGGAKVTPWTKLKCNSLAFTYPGGTIHQISYAVPIPVPVGTNLSDVIQFRIYRDNANTSGAFTGVDPYNTGGNASVGVMSFDTHINIDQIGSTQEYVK